MQFAARGLSSLLQDTVPEGTQSCCHTTVNTGTLQLSSPCQVLQATEQRLLPLPVVAKRTHTHLSLH